MWPLGESWAGRLTLRSARSVGLAQRRRIRRHFEAIDAHPAMPPAAMLFVRRLAMEAPVGRKSSVSWELGVRDRLAHLYDTAARPAEGQADPAAEAVVFPDEAAMMACLLADIRRGSAQGLWWWQTVWVRGTLPGSTAKILECRPNEVPAVFRILERLGEAVPVAASLEREQAAGIVRMMLASQAAPELAEAFEVARGPVDSKGLSPAATPSGAPEMGPRTVAREARVMPAGMPRLPVGADRLPPENRVLVALSLGLASAPHIVRSVGFAARAREWLRAEFAAIPVEPALSETSPSLETESVSTGPGLSSEVVESLSTAIPAGTKEKPPNLHRSQLAVEGKEESSTSRASQASSVVQETQSKRPTPLQPMSTSPASSAESARTPWPVAQADIRTRLGGALYLIAAFERLGMPECFEPAWPLSTYFSRWCVLELVARGLLDAAGLAERYRDDALWAALAQLDGRDPGLSIFQDFPVRKQFRIPAAWVTELHLPGERFAWASSHGRIVVWSCEGWVLVDRPLAKDERRDGAVRDELSSQHLNAGYGWERLHWKSAPRAYLGNDLKIAPALKFWLDCVLPAIRVWLARTMSLGQPDYLALVETLLLVPGDLFVTSTRVDFLAPIDQSRIPVRRAALDLDPGWLPAWGCSIRFHYGDAPGGLQ